MIETTVIESRILNEPRPLWAQSPSGSDSPEAVLILLDGEYYIDHIAAPELIANLQAQSLIPLTAVVYVSHLDAATRWTNSFCQPAFAEFLSLELQPWVWQRFSISDHSVPCYLGGLSLTGLAAAHAVLTHPQHFAGALCQSASFWWDDCRLIEDVKRSTIASKRFRITCGTEETQDYVEHGSNLIQRTSQLKANHATCEALLAKAHLVSYEEFEGGHTIASWKRDLPSSLTTLLNG